ncbi:hypothetical protein C1H46_024213 [Malus baccata]|uniref:HD-Zip IV C-terminal domain-containing protein n=1 Tax=Malus baccata TaxID=106549 RepID=A0A540LUK7_MALBA|nr:hypothetical protein C1H46_024213 [Malus baccata]
MAPGTLNDTRKYPIVVHQIPLAHYFELGHFVPISLISTIQSSESSRKKETSRGQRGFVSWDILSNGGIVQEMAHIANGRDTGNCVSLLRSANSSQSNMLILQESCSDPTASFVIYAPVDIVSMNVVLNGSDPDYVALLPSGFAILPDGAGIGDSGSGGGSLLTVAFQILVDSVPTAKLSLGSVATVNNLIACTVERIKAALS